MTDTDGRDDALRRAMRCNAELWLRPDAHLWIRPDADRFMPPGWRDEEARAIAIACGRDVRPQSVPAAKAASTNEGHRFTESERRQLLQMLDDSRALQAELATIRHNILRIKAGFKEGQPRWPKGSPDSVGGRWSGGSGTGGSATPSVSEKPIVAERSSDGQRLRITIRPPGIGDNGGPPVQEPAPPPPAVPGKEPPTAQLRNRVVREVAKWALRAALRIPAGPVGTALLVVETAWWLYESYPYIKSYLDGPKSLGELQSSVADSQKGYDIHHIVEQTPAENDGFSRDLIDGRDNLVRIPTLKHWELSGWYARRNKDYGRLSPRDYLRGKNWEERVRVGHEALRIHGVLTP